MVYSHHSHSGEFCGHARDTLEEVVKEAIRKNMQVLALTEHMPRDEDRDLYPEEIKEGTTTKTLLDLFDRYYVEARRLQAKYKDVITLLVGMEIDWIRDSSHKWIISLLTRQQLDIFVGSVHHVHGVPIDYNGELYAQALNKSSLRDLPLDLSAEEILFVEYFDTQLEMLHALKPPIVGHFDLIRLKSTDPNMSLKSCPIVWDKILRNLHFIVEYGGVIEINTAAWKKGLEDAYPNREICSVFAGMNGRFTFSDDSHGVSEVACAYDKLEGYLHEHGISKITIFERNIETEDDRFPGIGTRDIDVEEVFKQTFWTGPSKAI